MMKKIINIGVMLFYILFPKFMTFMSDGSPGVTTGG